MNLASRVKLTVHAAACSVLAVFCLLVANAAQSKELRSDQVPTNQGDWTLQDRQIYLQKRHTTIGNMIPDFSGGRRFLQAFSANTQANRPDQYTTISQRHAYYDALSYTLRFATDIPSSLRCIRFFDAAADVTSEYNLGAGDFADAMGFSRAMFEVIGIEELQLTPGTRTALAHINAELHKLNVGIAHRVLMNWKEPRDPRSATATARIPGLTFDLLMVEVEQTRVEQLIAGLDASTRTAIVADFKKHPTLRQFFAHGIPSMRRLLSIEKEWLPRLGYSSFDFFNKAHRIAIGQSYAFTLHGRSLNELTTYRQTGVLPQFACSTL